LASQHKNQAGRSDEPHRPRLRALAVVALACSSKQQVADSGASDGQLAARFPLGFDIGQPGLVAIDHEHPGDGSHTVAVDPGTHRVFFPLTAGADGEPVLRIMKPSGT
jgi:hypothetical protein